MLHAPHAQLAMPQETGTSVGTSGPPWGVIVPVVRHRLVAMRVRVRRRIGHGRIIGAVRVAVMLVVHVGVLVRHRLVTVLVLVPLREMKPHAERHQQGTGDTVVGRSWKSSSDAAAPTNGATEK